MTERRGPRTNLATRVPTDHHVASPLNMLPELGGKHSQKTAASTGMFPPTPKPRQAYKAQVLDSSSIPQIFGTMKIGASYPTQVGPPPAARPNAPQRKRVQLNAGRRPMASEAMPQKEAPIIKPTKRAHVAKRELVSEIPNSLESGVKVRATPYE